MTLQEIKGNTAMWFEAWFDIIKTEKQHKKAKVAK